jgi:hypothetical protein
MEKKSKLIWRSRLFKDVQTPWRFKNVRRATNWGVNRDLPRELKGTFVISGSAEETELEDKQPLGAYPEEWCFDTPNQAFSFGSNQR